MAVIESMQSTVPDRLLIALRHAGVAPEALQKGYGVSGEALAVLEGRPVEPLLPEDLDHLREDGYVYELWKGELIRMSPGLIRHGVDAGQLTIKLGAYLDTNRLGRLCVADTGFRVGPAQSVIAPDLAFIHNDRLGLFPPDEYGPVSPDLAVEVVSPGNTGIESRTRSPPTWRAVPARSGCSIPNANRFASTARTAPNRASLRRTGWTAKSCCLVSQSSYASCSPDTTGMPSLSCRSPAESRDEIFTRVTAPKG